MELNEPSAKYLVQPVFKQTEAGALPCDWESSILGELLARPPSYGINAPAIPYDSRFPTYLRITDISVDGRFSENGKTSVNHPAAENYFLHKGDLVFARTGASVGKSYLHRQEDSALVFAGFLIRLSPDLKKLNPAYLAHQVKTERYWEWVRTNSMRSGQPGINGKEYSSFCVPLPATVDEQNTIATTLTDADALIESLEQLLVKKRQIKQGAMQELLTGQRRLPGFSGDWMPGVLGDALGELVAGVSVNSEAHGATEGVPSVLKTSAIYDGQFDPAECKAIAKADVARAQTTPCKNSLLVSRMNTPDLVGEVGYVDADYPLLFLPDRVWMAQAKHGSHVNMRWLVSLLSSAHYKQRIRDAATGTSGSMKNISKTALRSLPVQFPCGNEQVAIATVLSDMDTEITALEARLTKARQLKQGMAQALLTGRIRLV